MTRQRALIFSVAILGAIILAVGLGLGAWAQGAAPAAPAGAGTVPAGPSVSNPMPATTPPSTAPRPGESAPPLDQALKMARNSDLSIKAQGVQGVAANYTQPGGDKNPEVVALLRDVAIHGETPDIRQAALGALGAHVTDNWQTLLQASYAPDHGVVEAVLVYFPMAPPSPAIDARLEALTHSPTASAAVQAVDLLMKRYAALGGDGIKKLAGQLGNISGDADAKAALQLIVIGRFTKAGGDSGVVPAVTEVLATSANPVARQAAAVVLGMICGGKTPRQQDFFKATLADFKFDLKLDDPDPRPLPVLIARLQNDPYELARESCAEALGSIGSEKSAGALAQCVLKDSSGDVRAAAAQALQFIPGTEALAALQAVVQSDPQARVRQFAVTSMGWMKDPRAATTLILATQDKDVEVRRLAAIQLGKLKTPEALTSLAALFHDPDEDVRWAAVVAVDGLRNVQATDALVGAAEDVSPLVSHAAETALQHLGVTNRKETNFKTSSGSPSA